VARSRDPDAGSTLGGISDKRRDLVLVARRRSVSRGERLIAHPVAPDFRGRQISEHCPPILK
jgi:hypothetical protein